MAKAVEVLCGLRTAQTMLHMKERISIETGKHRKVLFVESVLVEYENEAVKGFWRWKAVTLYGYWGNGEPGIQHWKYGDAEVPLWVVTLIYQYYPEYRKVRR